MIRQRNPIKRTPARKYRHALNPMYLDWLRQQKCLLCPTGMQGGAIEAAHVGVRGLGQKCADREAVSLCASHHRTGKQAHHVLGRKFWEFHKLDRDTTILAYHAAYLLETGEEL